MMVRASIVALSVLVASSCSTLMFWESSDEKEVVAAPEAVPTEVTAKPEAAPQPTQNSSAISELELKDAQVWRRVDELEEEVMTLKQKLKVIEQGLVLGLMPEELKDPVEQKSKPNVAHAETPKDVKLVAEEKVAEEPAADNELYQKRLNQAQELYQQGNYGKAVVEFTSIGKEFPTSDGGHLYWIGRSWGSLKEYQTARQFFLDFLKSYPNSSLAARGKLDLARVEMALGLRETALQRLRRIVQDHPYADAAELARMELKGMGQNL
jgi:TolA-binding protein